MTAKKATKKTAKAAPASAGGRAPAKKLEDFQNEATDLGIELQGGESIVDLKGLIVAAKKDQNEGSGSSVSGTKVPKDATLAHVDGGDGRIRTYSKAQHGAVFADYATEFASKEEGRSVVFE